jgi:hypothetical protein
MTATASINVSESLQALIDSRLDTIERMLVGRVPRSERTEIVREVESQIYELLSERGSEEPTREDLLGVLSRLDPPEAYLTETAASELLPIRGASVQQSIPPAPARNYRIGETSCMLGISALLLISMLLPLAITLVRLGLAYLALMAIWYVVIVTAGVCSVLGIVFAANTRLRGGWAISGLVTSIIALLLSLAGAIMGMIGL